MRAIRLPFVPGCLTLLASLAGCPREAPPPAPSAEPRASASAPRPPAARSTGVRRPRLGFELEPRTEPSAPTEPRASASGTEGKRLHPAVADRLRCRSL